MSLAEQLVGVLDMVAIWDWLGAYSMRPTTLFPVPFCHLLICRPQSHRDHCSPQTTLSKMPPSYPTATNDMQPSASDAIYIIESCPDPATSGMHVLFGKDGMKGVMAYGALSPACSVQVDLLGVHDGDTGQQHYRDTRSRHV